MCINESDFYIQTYICNHIVFNIICRKSNKNLSKINMFRYLQSGHKTSIDIGKQHYLLCMKIAF